MRIEVRSLPPVEYSLNWRGHWAKRYQAGREYQLAVFGACVGAMQRLQSPPWRPGFPPFQKARLDLDFIFTTHRRRDTDNILSRFKPGLDAIIQAGLVIDDDIEHLTIGEVRILVDKEQAPMTVINLEVMTR